MTKNLSQSEVKRRVRAGIASCGVSQAEVCRRLGITPRHLSRLLSESNADARPLSLDQLSRVLYALEYDLDPYAIVLGEVGW